MSTLLTVGYGDIYPITTLGRIMAICIAYLRVGVVAIPTGIISAGFVEQYQRKSNISDLKDMDIKENSLMLQIRKIGFFLFIVFCLPYLAYLYQAVLYVADNG